MQPGPFSAALAGALVGALGGLLGLGGAEFRLPFWVGVFRYSLRRAIPLNLAISFIAVLIAALSRWALAGQAPLPSAIPVALAMMVGGVVGAAIGSHWVGRASDSRLHTSVRVLLIGIGLLLVVESVTPHALPGLPAGSLVGVAVGMVARIGIGAVRTLLGVAGGIPTLVLRFGVPIKAAGTMSLLISAPAMIVGLARHHVRGAFADMQDVRRLVPPMATGTVVGSGIGGLVVGYAPADGVKLLLGCVLIGSALRVFKTKQAAVGPA